MPWRTMTLTAAAAASILGTSLITSQPAEARAFCMYMAHDPHGRLMADGYGRAVKESWACNRARRRCTRELERKRRQGKAGRGSCRKMGQAR